MPELAVTIATAKGPTREENQDRVLAATFISGDPAESFELFALCDGVGGLRSGGQCASIALASFLVDLTRTRKSADRAARLRRAVIAANRAVYESFKEQGGTTIAAILFNEGGATVCSVGDSRVYAVEWQRSVKQLTIDDTIGARVAQIQGREEEPDDRGPFANHLAQFIGQETEPVPQLIEIQASGDSELEGVRRSYFLSTDGVHRIPKQVLADIVQTAKGSRDAAYRLLVVSEWLGGQDNASIVWVDPRLERLTNAYRDAVPGLVLHDSFGEMHFAISPADDLSVTTKIGESHQEYGMASGLNPRFGYPRQNERSTRAGYIPIAHASGPSHAPVSQSSGGGVPEDGNADATIGVPDIESPVGEDGAGSKSPRSTGKRRKKPVRDREARAKRKKADVNQPELDIQISNEPE